MSLTTLIAPDAIAARVAALAAEIRADVDGTPLVALVVLKGGFVFGADLLRALWPHELTVAFVGLGSYAGTRSTGAVTLTQGLGVPLAGRHVLVIEDIVDTGRSLRFLLDLLQAEGPASVRVAALLDKPSRREVDVAADFVGFTIPDLFVVGYGLDLDQRYRHLPSIVVVEP